MVIFLCEVCHLPFLYLPQVSREEHTRYYEILEYLGSGILWVFSATIESV